MRTDPSPSSAEGEQQDLMCRENASNAGLKRSNGSSGSDEVTKGTNTSNAAEAHRHRLVHGVNGDGSAGAQVYSLGPLARALVGVI